MTDMQKAVESEDWENAETPIWLDQPITRRELRNILSQLIFDTPNTQELFPLLNAIGKMTIMLNRPNRFDSTEHDIKAALLPEQIAREGAVMNKGELIITWFACFAVGMGTMGSILNWGVPAEEKPEQAKAGEHYICEPDQKWGIDYQPIAEACIQSLKKVFPDWHKAILPGKWDCQFVTVGYPATTVCWRREYPQVRDTLPGKESTPKEGK